MKLVEIIWNIGIFLFFLGQGGLEAGLSRALCWLVAALCFTRAVIIAVNPSPTPSKESSPESSTPCAGSSGSEAKSGSEGSTHNQVQPKETQWSRIGAGPHHIADTPHTPPAYDDALAEKLYRQILELSLACEASIEASRKKSALTNPPSSTTVLNNSPVDSTQKSTTIN